MGLSIWSVAIMKILRNLTVPTGNILIVEGDQGKLECLSLGDYGRNQNIKADFLGFTDEIHGVANGEAMPLQDKWVVTLSTQYGCSMGCTFCDVPMVGAGVNATSDDLTGQVVSCLTLHPDVTATKRLNIHYARMGEPTFNPNIIPHANQLLSEVRPYIGRSHVHPVISTMMPKNNPSLFSFLQDWCDLKNYRYRGSAGLQLSINSTNEKQREEMFNGNALSLKEVSSIGRDLPDPVGRKYALNIALADSYEVDAVKLLDMFDPNKFMVKITPLHVTNSCINNNISTHDGYGSYTPYSKVESKLKDAGFDVLVFIPSLDEDRGRITCGNAILSGTRPECDYMEVEY